MSSRRTTAQKTSNLKIVLAAVGVVVTILSLVVSILVFRASVDYWIQAGTSVKGINTVVLNCKNGGGMDGDFNLVLTLTNVTFSNQTALPYLQIDNSTVQFRFVLHKGDSSFKPVFFVANDTEQFSLSLSLSGNNFLDFLLLKGNPIYPTYLQYQWNKQQSTFNLVQ
jgi:hypothetical protein